MNVTGAPPKCGVCDVLKGKGLRVGVEPFSPNTHGGVGAHACIHACIHTYTHTYMHTYMRACIHTYTHTYTHIYTYIHICNDDMQYDTPITIGSTTPQ